MHREHIESKLQKWARMFRQIRKIRRELASISRVTYHLLRLKKMQWMRKQDLERIQLKKLRMMIKYAYDYVPYYHELFDSARIKPKDIKCLKDLQKIPLTDKKAVQKDYSRMIARGMDLANCYMVSTTGSTGRPLKIFYDDIVDNHRCALWRYVFLECGLYPRDTLVFIHALGRKSYVKPRFSAKHAHARAYMKLADLSLYNPINENIEILERIGPDAIYTYPSVLAILAKHVLEEKISKIRPKLIFTIAETVTPHCRKIVQAFGVDISDIYGSAEFERMAFECNEHTGLHVMPDCVLEFLKEGEAVNFGEEGEIVVTGLYNYVMPLIRYKIRDVGVPSDERCSCGRNFPLIKTLVGRTDDFLVLPNGTIISPRNINVIENIPGILQYQTVQEKRDRFVVKVMKGEKFGEDTINQIKEIIKAGCLGEDITVDVKIVDKIPKERTGKIRTIISKVNRPRIIN